MAKSTTTCCARIYSNFGISFRFSKSNAISILLLFTLGCLWGSGYSIARYATTHGVSALGYAFWQSLGPSIFLLCLCYSAKPQINQVNDSRRLSSIWFYLFTGLIGIAIPNSNMYLVAAHLPASIIAVLVNTVPLITYALALITRIERFNFLRFFGILLGFLGISLILYPQLRLPQNANFYWLLQVLITPLCFSICAIFVSTRSEPHTTKAIATGMLCSSTILLLPIVLLTHNFYFLHFPLRLVDGLILLEIVLSTAGYLLFILLLKKAGAVYYSLVGGIVMLTGIFWGWLIFNERFNLWTSIAAFFILLAIFLVSLGQKSRLLK